MIRTEEASPHSLAEVEQYGDLCCFLLEKKADVDLCEERGNETIDRSRDMYLATQWWRFFSVKTPSMIQSVGYCLKRTGDILSKRVPLRLD